jgi:hypothetical protein
MKKIILALCLFTLFMGSSYGYEKLPLNSSFDWILVPKVDNKINTSAKIIDIDYETSKEEVTRLKKE